MKITRKAYAYITHRNCLLVFAHRDYPEAGIQIPGGTIEPGEAPEDAVLREAYEETGLKALTLVALLGYYEREMPEFTHQEIQQRWMFHLSCDEPTPPENWLHIEENPSEGDERDYAFQLFWVNLPDGVPDLIGGRGDMLDKLIESMGIGI